MAKSIKEALQRFITKFNDRGEEIPDPTPLEVPIGHERPPTLQQQIARLMALERYQERIAAGADTVEEGMDFDIPDEDPTDGETVHTLMGRDRSYDEQPDGPESDDLGEEAGDPPGDSGDSGEGEGDGESDPPDDEPGPAGRDRRQPGQPPAKPLAGKSPSGRVVNTTQTGRRSGATIPRGDVKKPNTPASRRR